MISGEDKAFLRDYEVDSSQTFLHFHKLIQDNLDYDSKQLASFFLADENWNKGLELTLFDMENEGGPAAIPMGSVKISDIIKGRKERLLYVYDIFTDNSFFIELMDLYKPAKDIQYPMCSASVGDPPIQSSIDNSVFSEEDEEFMDDSYKEMGDDEFEFGQEGFDGEDDDK